MKLGWCSFLKSILLTHKSTSEYKSTVRLQYNNPKETSHCVKKYIFGGLLFGWPILGPKLELKV